MGHGMKPVPPLKWRAIIRGPYGNNLRDPSNGTLTHSLQQAALDCGKGLAWGFNLLRFIRRPAYIVLILM